jgi:ADP-heptose:LPS heptosyltransferase
MKENHLRGRETPERVIIFRALQLGDMLCAVPALRSLRAALPETLITLVGLPWARSFAKRFNFYLDDFIEFPGFPGLPEQTPDLTALPRFLQEVQWLESDLTIQLHGAGHVTNLIVSLFGSRRLAGFTAPGAFTPEGSFTPYPEHGSEIQRNLALMEHLGFPSQGLHMEFPLFSQDWSEFTHLQEGYGLHPGQYVVIHPGARARERRWPAEKFARVADHLARRGLQVVLTGAEAELSLLYAVQDAMKTQAANLGGRTSLGSLGALLSNARLLVCNDTGVSHVAAGLLTPSVVLFSTSDPERWAPVNENLHRRVEGAMAAKVGAVLEQVEYLLQKERIYAG